MNKRKISSEGILFVVSAPSGTGKTTMVKRLLKGDKRLTKTISHTTRSPRPGERNGRDYYYVDRHTFRRMIKKRNFAEWATVYRDHYGTSHATIRKSLRGMRDVILVIEAKGARQIRRAYPNAVFIAVLPPTAKDLRKRISKRSGSAVPSVYVRLNAARAEVRRMSWYDYVVVNDRLANAVDELSSIIQAERLRMKRQAGHFRQFLR